jgi:hypothetical protein
MEKIIFLNLFLHIMITKCSLLKIFFLKIGIVEIFIMKVFILQITIVRILLMIFFSTYCDCRNLKDNLLKLNYDCRMTMIYFLFANCSYRNPLDDVFFPLHIAN